MCKHGRTPQDVCDITIWNFRNAFIFLTYMPMYVYVLSQKNIINSHYMMCGISLTLLPSQYSLARQPTVVMQPECATKALSPNSWSECFEQGLIKYNFRTKISVCLCTSTV